MARLVLSREGRTTEYELLELTTLGRSSRNTIRLPEGRASREHARIVRENGSHVLEDLDSSNGTYVNEIKVKRQELRPGDTVRIGKTLFTYIEQVDDPMVGTRLGNYQIEERLGQGGMGSVYRARQVSMQRDVALKVMKKELARDPNFIKDFMREARMAGKLLHPNIIGIHDFGDEEGVYYFSMEYVRGENLADRVRRSGPLSPEEVIDVGLQVAEGLQHAHEQEVIHQDIKPENLLQTESGVVKIADLGLAKSSSHSGLAWDKPVMGTPQYVAPEVVRRMPPDPRSDIYSLGATLYYIAVGRAPFEHDNPTEIVRAHLDQMPPDPREFRPDLPQALAEVLLSCLSKDPARRPSSCRELTERLRALDLAPPEPRGSRRRPALPIAPAAPAAASADEGPAAAVAVRPQVEAKAKAAARTRERHTEPLPNKNPWRPVAIAVMWAATVLVAAMLAAGVYWVIRSSRNSERRVLEEAESLHQAGEDARAEELLQEFLQIEPDSPLRVQAEVLLREIRDARSGSGVTADEELTDIRRRHELELLSTEQATEQAKALLERGNLDPRTRERAQAFLLALQTPASDATPPMPATPAIPEAPTRDPEAEAQKAWETAQPLVAHRIEQGEVAAAQELLQAYLEHHTDTTAALPAQTMLKTIRERQAQAARDDLQAARRLRNEGNLPAAVDRYDALLRAYAGTPSARQAAQDLAAIQDQQSQSCFKLWDRLRPRLATLSAPPLQPDAAELIKACPGAWEASARDLANQIEAAGAFERALRRKAGQRKEMNIQKLGRVPVTVVGDRLISGSTEIGWNQVWLDEVFDLVPTAELNPLERLGGALYFHARNHRGYARGYLDSLGEGAAWERIRAAVEVQQRDRLLLHYHTFDDALLNQQWEPLAGRWDFRGSRLRADGDEASIELIPSFPLRDVEILIAPAGAHDGALSLILAQDPQHQVALRRRGEQVMVEVISGKTASGRAEATVAADRPLRLIVAVGMAEVWAGPDKLMQTPAPGLTERGRLRLESAGAGAIDAVGVALGRPAQP